MLTNISEQLRAIHEGMKDKKEILREWIEELLEEEAIFKTDDVETAFYYFEGQLYAPDYDMGIRGTDHNTFVADGLNTLDVMKLGTIIIPELHTYISPKPIPELDEYLERQDSR